MTPNPLVTRLITCSGISSNSERTTTRPNCSFLPPYRGGTGQNSEQRKREQSMSTDPAKIPHGRSCKRPAPVLRQSWKQEPEIWCPGCGRTAPAPNTHADQEKTTRPQVQDLPPEAAQPQAGAHMANGNPPNVPDTCQTPRRTR